jgi:predicted aconitase with swiveling domain
MSAQREAFAEMPEKIVLRGRKVVGGVAEGEAIVTQDTISGWGGINEKGRHGDRATPRAAWPEF